VNVNSIEKLLYWGVAIAFCLLLCAYALILPPYEGFDEVGHYSYISYLADTNKIPILGITPLDETVENDRAGLPKPYTSVPPYEENYGITYKNFFIELSDSERKHLLRRYWSETGTKVNFVGADGEKPEGKLFPSIDSYNWIAQHPPLFYALMTVPYYFTSELPAGIRLTWLRFFSVLFAAGSLLFWIKSISLVPGNTRRILVLGGLTILFFPSLFFDLARLGNDSLAAFLFAGAFYFLLASLYQSFDLRIRNLLCLSLMLGLGLLTKLFFLPIVVGILGFLVWFWRRGGGDILPWLLVSKYLTMLIGVMLLISGWWYVLCFHRYGVLFVSDEMMAFRFMAEPLGVDLTLTAFAVQMSKNLAGFLTSFLWSGTWSWIPRNLTTYLVCVPLVILVLFGAGRSFKRRSQKNIILVACVFILTPLVLGFVNHMFMIVKFTGVGSGVGGYYLFVVWPVIGCLAALCFKSAETSVGKYALIISFCLVFVFEISGWWFMMQIFAGVVEKTGYLNRGVGSIGLTPGNMAFVIERLRGLDFPYFSNILYASSVLMKLFVLWLSVFRYQDAGLRLNKDDILTDKS
jgi:hypothetical protein